MSALSLGARCNGILWSDSAPALDYVAKAEMITASPHCFRIILCKREVKRQMVRSVPGMSTALLAVLNAPLWYRKFSPYSS